MMHSSDFTRLSRRSLLLGAAAALAARPFAAFARTSGFPASAAIRNLDGQIRLPGGRCIGYADFGSETGPLVLFCHGTPGSRLEAALIAEEALAANVRLVAIDRPGVGLSSSASGRRILDWPSDAEAVADSLGYSGTAFGVVGISGGAPYALACAKCIPHRLTHVAIVSGHSPMAEANSGRGSQDAMIEFMLRRPRLGMVVLKTIIRRLHKHPDKVIRRVLSETAASDQRLILGDPTNYRGFHANLLAATSQGAGQVMYAIRRLALSWGFRLADVPTFPISIWQGGCDPIAPPAAGRYFHRQLAGSELILDPSAGHATMLKWHAKEIFARFG
ncbi:MAG TPA: alpha/beta hydrolase [Lacipirellulaceae bacterium]|nr:alpha/beta hydrolase [Lacipirellulaceae bacterium]